jgi:aldehyde dehydrogenase (NAD+)
MTSAQLPCIIGDERIATSESIEVVDPSTGRVCATVPRGGPDLIEQAVARARAAFREVWARAAARERASRCRRLADAIRTHRAELGELETLDTGKPLRQSLADADVAARYFEFYGCAVEALHGETLPPQPGLVAYTLREPHGVCGHIIPWNYPLQVAARTLAPAIAAGNCCVLKPAEDAPLTSLRLAELALEAGLPAGVVNVVPGTGAEAGAALASCAGVDHLSFTGSREVGAAVMAAAAGHITAVTLELGGKSPQVVFADAPRRRVARVVAGCILENAGQNCSAGSRLLVHESRHRELVTELAEIFTGVRIGEGRTDPDMGPLISQRQRERVLSYIADALEVGQPVCGGSVPQGGVPPGGFYVEPTILDMVPSQSQAAQEEIFGPVLVVIPFATDEEALALANGTSYGLTAGVWTADVARAHRMAHALDASQVFVNDYGIAGGVELPFGGCRQSGFGREKGVEALREYTRVKTVVVRMDDSAEDGA